MLIASSTFIVARLSVNGTKGIVTTLEERSLEIVTSDETTWQQL